MANNPNEGNSSLASNPGVQSLILALKLGEGFVFHIVRCESPRDTDAVLDCIQKDSLNSASSPRSIIRLPTDKDSTELTDGLLLVKRILEQIVYGGEEFAANSILVLDATRARFEDKEHWIWLFKRLNETRNRIANSLNLPFILIAPEMLAAEFARNAPDFWSIRSVSISVTAQSIQSTAPTVTAFADSTSILSERSTINPPTEHDIESLLASARERVVAKRNDRSALVQLSTLLFIHSDERAKKGDVTEALRNITEAELILRALAHENPHSFDNKVPWITTLGTLANRHADLGHLGESQEIYKKALDAAYVLTTQHPDHLESYHSLLLTSIGYAQLLQKTGDIKKAVEICRRTISIIEPIKPKITTATEILQFFGMLLNLCGHLLQLIGQPEESRPFCNDAVNIQQLIKVRTNSSHDRTLLSQFLRTLGDADFRVHNYRAAEVSYHEANKIAEETFSNNPNDSSRFEFAAVHYSLGILYTVNSNPREAARHLVRAADLLNQITDISAHFPKNQYLVSSYRYLSAVSIALGDGAAAQIYQQKADALSEKPNN